MAVGFNLPNGAFRLTPEEGGSVDIGKALRSGFDTYSKGIEAGYKPKTMQEALLHAQLQNAHDRTINQYLPRSEEARIANTEANTGLTGQQTYAEKIRNQFLPESERARIDKLKAPAQLSGETAQLFALRNSLPEGPDRQRVDQIITMKSQGSAGTNLSYDPNTGAINYSQGGSRSGPANQVVTDAEGNQTVISKPTTPAITAQQKSSIANVARQYVAEHLEQPYIGTGSNIELGMDRYNYPLETNPVTKKAIGDRLVKAAVAAKMAPEYATLQLNAQGVQPTVSSLREQEKAIKQGWAEGIPLAVNNLPNELQQQANDLHAKELQKLKTVRDQYFAKGFPIKVDAKKEEKVIHYEKDANGRYVPKK